MKRILKNADIFQAARYDVTRLQECLTEGAGADINQTDRDGDTPLIHAAMMGNLPCLQYLLANGADPNIQNNVREFID
jgi:ankyrin repeat protein